MALDFPIKIGTRGSPLALAQAYETRDRLKKAHLLGDNDFEIKVISTTGDKVLDRPLAEIGGKGLFTKELEVALYNNDIDIAVHSMKDVATILPDGLYISTILPREEVEDAFISYKAKQIIELAEGCLVGTSSLRRAAQLKHNRPDLKVIDFRGNVQTRLKKLADGVADATFLAVAGLKRLNMDDIPYYKIDKNVMLPAVAQGAIGIEIAEDNNELRDILAPINHNKTFEEVSIERVFLRKLDGSCRTPIAAHAIYYEDKNMVSFEGQLFSLDGAKCYKRSFNAPLNKAYKLVENAAEEILAQSSGVSNIES